MPVVLVLVVLSSSTEIYEFAIEHEKHGFDGNDAVVVVQ